MRKFIHKGLLAPVLLAALSLSPPAQSQVIERQFDGFTTWVDCDLRSPVKFEYLATKDKGNLDRHRDFYFDSEVPRQCQASSTWSYKTAKNAPKYDRGHFVPANHLDDNRQGIKQSNYMTNITIQSRNLNRGAWYQTEVITECYRDIEPVRVIGGAIYREQPLNRLLVKSHKQITPNGFWKVLIRGDRAIAWLFPNDERPTKKRTDDFLISLRSLEKITGERFNVPEDIKDQRPDSSWVVPIGCDKS